MNATPKDTEPPSETPDAPNPDRSGDDGSWLKINNQAKTTLAGVLFLALCYLANIWLVVGTLSAYLAHEELRTDSGREVSYSSVQRARAWIDLKFHDIEAGLAARDTIGLAETRVEAALDALLASDDRFLNWGARQDHLTLTENRRAALSATCTNPSEDSRALCDAFQAFTTARIDLTALYEGNAAETFRTAQLRAIDQQNEIIEAHPLGHFVEAAAFFEDFGYFFLIYAPADILVMILTMSMGVLGSLMTMTWSFIRSDIYMPPRRFVLQPFIGMMSAVIVMVFLKAGQFSMTASQDAGPLSAYMLSFVGIISGLTSDLAYERIANVSRNFFQSQRPPRWALGLEAAMTAQSISSAHLARALDMNEKRLEDILAHRATANADQQKLAAAYLRADIRDLFSDLRPDGDQFADPETGAPPSQQEQTPE